MIEQNQHCELIDRGYLVTASEFDPSATAGIRIQGQWTAHVIGGDFDFLQILTRCDGMPTPSYGEAMNGIEFQVQLWSKPRSQAPSIAVRGSALQLGPVMQSGTLLLQTGQTYTFDIVDTGAWVTFTLTDGVNSALAWAAVIADNTTSRHVVFHNRENISGTNVAWLDDVAISAYGAVMPATAANVEGNAAYSGFPALPQSRTQVLMQPSAFGTQPTSGTITELQFRRDQGSVALAAGTATVQVTLGTAGRTPTTMSSTFAENWGARQQVAYPLPPASVAGAAIDTQAAVIEGATVSFTQALHLTIGGLPAAPYQSIATIGLGPTGVRAAGYAAPVTRLVLAVSGTATRPDATRYCGGFSGDV